MSSRYGLLLVSEDYSSRLADLFGALGFDQPELLGPTDSVMPGKADDHRVRIAFASGWTILGGQYDFNVLPETSLADLPTEFRADKQLVYFGVEGTSGCQWFEEMLQGQLVRRYSEMEGKTEVDRCLGPAPPSDKYGQVNEWDLLKFGLPHAFPIEKIGVIEAVEYRFLPRRRKESLREPPPKPRSNFW
jgi:hypothetical protein